MSDDFSELSIPGEQLFSRRRVAALFDCSVETIGRKIKAGDLRAVKIRRLVRIPHSEVVRILAGNDPKVTA